MTKGEVKTTGVEPEEEEVEMQVLVIIEKEPNGMAGLHLRSKGLTSEGVVRTLEEALKVARKEAAEEKSVYVAQTARAAFWRGN